MSMQRLLRLARPSVMSAGKRSAFKAMWPKTMNSHLMLPHGVSWRCASSSSHSRFEAEPRLQGVEAAELEATVGTLNQLLFMMRLSEKLSDYLENMMENRLFESEGLMRKLRIPVFEEGQLKFDDKPLHWSTAPRDTAYAEIKRQTYWATLHAWLLHCKCKDVIAKSGALGMGLGMLMTKSVFTWQWDQVRFWMHCANVPGMSLKSELEHFQGFMFDFCTKLDDIWEQEAPEGTAAALAPGSGSSLGVRLQAALRENVYEFNQVVEEDDDFVYDMTVYLLRQKLALEALPSEAFLSGGFGWADFSW
eukprot:gnl/MRDRNA2_/MRDRNA2_105926_c0_seq1.p1 gnl/MRDRNA2_/MRDRNA2_105926_c0~~gnl/MRDRNA2_/MRDRNA2_105926_c0_seq1.p1  ORF type:complete len:306 (+),score=58.00 gnl/MRDRNA2_/MRDRNA2_105926_c0_seq1:87-1004(+)